LIDMTDGKTHSTKRIFLVMPGQKYVNYYGQTELCKMMGKKKFMVSLALPMIAAITPPEYQVRIIDEELEPLPEEIPEIVGISTLATTAKRAYEIGDWYRSKGATVIIGGPYVSFMTDEAIRHADAVVVGEAEGAWQKCLQDFEQGALQKIYNSGEYVDFKEIPIPRWDLVDMKKVFQVGIQVSRGCPYKCEFCLVTNLFGHKMRYREISNVVEEIKSLPVKKMLFVDDNLTANKRYAHDLMKALAPLKISWGCMSSIEIAREEELLTAMNNAGCFNILIGFESLNAGSLFETKKKQNRDALIYEEAIKKIHSHGIHITASFVIGFDNDTAKEFDHLYEFTQRTGLSYVNFNILGAPYGSELQKRLTAEGRMYNIDTDMMGGLFPCIHYYKMSQIDLFDKYLETLTKIYSFESLYKKASVLFGDGYFRKPYNDGKPGAGFVIRLLAKLFKEYAFKPEPYKRKFYNYMISLILRKKVATDMGFSHILSMTSYHNHIKKIIGDADTYRQMIKKYDIGPWEKVKPMK